MEIKRTSVLLCFRKKTLITVMRTFIFLLVTSIYGFTPNNAFSQNTKITVDKNKIVNVDQVFDLIMEQTDYTFLYQVDMFKNYPKVELKKGVFKANDLLKKSLSNGRFNVEFTTNNTIVVTKKNLTNLQEEFTITGKVTDEAGNPLPGVTVYISDQNPQTVGSSGTQAPDFLIRGTSTDFDGNYTIQLNAGNYIAATGIGFQFYTAQINSKITSYNITMKEEVSELDEVVLIGYGQQTRKEVTGAVSSAKATEIVKNAVGLPSFDRALSGLIKGVNVVQNNGRPGAGADINVRGITSPFASGSDNNPLFVIDGVPFQTNPAISGGASAGNPLLSINPNDIESIDVLKDAAATAIYGSRGANGVILVNTKTGKRNQKTSVDFSTSATFATPIATRDYLNTNDWKVFLDNFLANSVEASNADPFVIVPSDLTSLAYVANITGGEFDPITFTDGPVFYDGLVNSFLGNTTTDWADIIYRNPAYTQQYNLSVSGGNESTAYSFSLSHSDQEGLIKSDDFKQYNVRVSLDSDLNKTLKVGLTSNIGISNNNSGFGRQDLNRVLNTRPDITPFDEDGLPLQYQDGLRSGTIVNYANPLAQTTGFNNENNSLTILGNIYAEAKLFKGFKVRYDVNVSRFNTKTRNFQSFADTRGTPFSAFFAQENAALNLADITNTNLISNITANYSTAINKNVITALAGYSWDRSQSDIQSSTFTGFPDTEVLINADNAINRLPVQDVKVNSGLNSFFSRLTYNYDSKYFITANFRTDKSSRFGPNNQRAYFPSVSARWNIANENFLRGNNTVNNLSFRFGIGRTGSNNISDFSFLQFFNTGAGLDGLYAGNPTVGLTAALPNLDIKWETTDETNFGFNYELFNNRLRGSIDIYNRKTKGALIPGFFPLETGASEFVANFADLTNKGFEIDLGGDIIRSKDFNWSMNFNISQNKNILDKFVSDFLDPALIDSYEVGREVNLIRGYEVESIFQNQTEVDDLNALADDGTYQEFGTAAGDYKYVDLNGDGEINLDDRKVLGSSQPDFFGGLNTSFTYKAFELSAFFNYSVGGEALDIGQLNASNITVAPLTNILAEYSDVWTATNTDAQYPRAVLGDPNDNTRISDRTFYDTSYIRLKTLQLNYSLPQDIISKAGFSGATIFVSGSNLLTFTDFPGVDPEATGAISSTGSTIGQNFYPIAKTWSLGLNVKF